MLLVPGHFGMDCPAQDGTTTDQDVQVPDAETYGWHQVLRCT